MWLRASSKNLLISFILKVVFFWVTSPFTCDHISLTGYDGSARAVGETLHVHTLHGNAVKLIPYELVTMPSHDIEQLSGHVA